MYSHPKRPAISTPALLAVVAGGALVLLAGAVLVAVLSRGSGGLPGPEGGAGARSEIPVSREPPTGSAPGSPSRTVRLEATGPEGMQVNWSVGDDGDVILDAPGQWSLEVAADPGTWVTLSVLGTPEAQVSCRVVAGSQTPEPILKKWTAICSATVS